MVIFDRCEIDTRKAHNTHELIALSTASGIMDELERRATRMGPVEAKVNTSGGFSIHILFHDWNNPICRFVISVSETTGLKLHYKMQPCDPENVEKWLKGRRKSITCNNPSGPDEVATAISLIKRSISCDPPYSAWD
jgi:hypothetical protein